MPQTDLATLIALITAMASALVALLSLLFNRNTERELKRLEAELSDASAEKNARRDYRYDALKRLYGVYEPIRFQLVEASEAARRFILELSQRWQAAPATFPEGSLPGRGYYQLATV